MTAIAATSMLKTRLGLNDMRHFFGRQSSGGDLAPKFYPILSSPWRLGLPGWAVGATGAGAELSA
jgi:hypothetical protein